jgi:hypothetical protein
MWITSLAYHQQTEFMIWNKTFTKTPKFGLVFWTLRSKVKKLDFALHLYYVVFDHHSMDVKC